MRKMICVILALLLTFVMLAGCQEKASNAEPSGKQDEITDALRQQIRAYFHYSGEDSENTIAGYRYYGTYRGYVILMSAGFLAAIDEVVIGGRIFRWGSSKLRILAYKDGQAQPLQDIYDVGEITEDDLDQILAVHKEHFAMVHKLEYGDDYVAGYGDVNGSGTTQSTSPTQTTAPPTVDYSNMAFHSPTVVLSKGDVTASCSYSVCYVDTNRIRLCIYVEYLGEPMDYAGCSLGWWGPAWLVQEDVEESYILECGLLAFPDDVVDIQIEQGFETQHSYYFSLPEDAPAGNYTVRFYLFGEMFEF